MTPAVSITGTLCELCHEFVDNLFAFDFLKQENYPSQWLPAVRGREWTPEKPWGDAFHHHEDFDSLSRSARTCEFCGVLHADLALMDPDLRQGWLGLYPFWSAARTGQNKLKGHFRAGFRESLTSMPWGSSKIGSIPLHSFRVCRRGPLGKGEEVTWFDAHRRLPAVPPTLHSSNISTMVTKWKQECREAHPNCAEIESDHELPTRVIEIGENEPGQIRLYESKGEKAPYVTLSHCWGGAIPSVTTETNMMARTKAMNIDHLPQNFKDAIQVTRALGMRYLWIDALCIVQDSAADWKREAGRMFSVYAGASVVISVLDAAASTLGFLKPNRVPLAVINDEYAVQKVFPELDDYLIECPLNSRGWCMQERLLAPRLLHFGKEQMFWECRTEFKCEDGRKSTGDSDGHVMAEFMKIRKRMGVSSAQGAELEWNAWYQLLEEYTTRSFTVPTDKLPAVAGAAALFKSTKPTATYVAGLWKEDIARGLLWCANYYHQPGRKVWGISSVDKISKLSKPPKKRGPSWSWAAVDGQIDFWARKIGKNFVVEVLDVKMDEETESAGHYPGGMVGLKGLVGTIFYHPPESPDYDVGALTLDQAESPDPKSGSFNSCVMDLDRRSSRTCWGIKMAQSNRKWYMLVLDKRDDGSFQRIGMAMANFGDDTPERFQMREIEVV
ncbi:HET-domain-containing protein [Hypomontagnella submonticulosa]|nr:HET-domain-containing protein [Hypomontagnella submonticulosa]